LRSDLLDVLVIDGPDEFFTKALDKQGIQYRMVGKDFDFPNRDSLIKAAAAFDSVFSAVHGTTYRIASTSSEKLAMENEIQKVISEAAQPATAPPVAATTVRRDAAGFPMFDSGGYSNTVLLDEFYIGSTEHLKVGPIMVYFQEFVQELRRIDGCGGAIGDRSFAELTAKASVGFLQQYVEQSRESQAKSKGSFEDAFKQGAKDAARQYEVVPLADADAHLFSVVTAAPAPLHDRFSVIWKGGSPATDTPRRRSAHALGRRSALFVPGRWAQPSSRLIANR
jgi:hypothetical protein